MLIADVLVAKTFLLNYYGKTEKNLFLRQNKYFEKIKINERFIL